MKLSTIERKHLLEAAQLMKAKKYSRWSKYWLRLPDGDYQFKKLIRTAIEIATNKEIANDFFQSNKGYRNYIEQKFGYEIIFKVPNNISFFEKNDFILFQGIGGRKYRKNSSQDIKNGNLIKKQIFEKTNIWAKLLDIPGWSVEDDNTWQISGTFKPYSWAKIYKNGDKDKKVFFTIGVDSTCSALIYKIDCQRSNYNKKHILTNEQVQIFDNICKGSGAQWNEIPSKYIDDYDWETLSDLTADFINHYEFLYDEILLALNVTNFVKNVKNKLTKTSLPQNTYASLPKKKYSFKGIVIDYDSENKFKKKIGNSGEDLVIEFEKDYLKSLGHYDLANEVMKVLDGEGYDILSFDLNRNKKYIEVKTTTGIDVRPFIMTDNEWEFMKRNSSNYSLYRVYDYNQENNSGNFFILEGDLEELVFVRPKQLELFVKNLN